ncbi:MAG: rhomboid family intramembrane serine protease [Pseudomonadota bacterium]
MNQRQPIFNVPAIVVGVIALFAAIHIIRQFLTVAMDNDLLLALAFIPARYSGYLDSFPGGAVTGVTSFVTHMMVHGDVTHLMFNSAWFLAFGGAIALRTGGWRFLAFTVVTGVAGAAVFLVFNFGQLVPMVGASGAVSGMMAAVLRFMFPAIDTGRFAALREAPRTIPRLSLYETLTDVRIIAITAVWLLINLLSVLGLFGPTGSGGIAWEAHVGGFVAGLMLFGLFDPWRRPPPKPYLVQ